MPPPLAVVPAWVVPNPTEVRDCHLIAHRAFRESRSDRMGGVYAAVNWVTGGQRAPVTEREEPPTVVLVRAEMWVALSIGDGLPPLTPRMWTDIGAEPREARTDNRLWCRGVDAVLGWLIGVQKDPPFALPRRPVPTVEELYQEALAAKPHGFWPPEDRQRVRFQAEKDAVRFRALAAYADGT
jgi:hypothetical protein